MDRNTGKLALIAFIHPSVSRASYLEVLAQRTGVPLMTLNDGPAEKSERERFLSSDIYRIWGIKTWIFKDDRRLKPCVILDGVVTNISHAEETFTFLRNRGFGIETALIAPQTMATPDEFKDELAAAAVLRRLGKPDHFHSFDSTKAKPADIHRKLSSVVEGYFPLTPRPAMKHPMTHAPMRAFTPHGSMVSVPA